MIIEERIQTPMDLNIDRSDLQGDLTNLEYYGRIRTIPTLYNLCSTCIFERLYEQVDQFQVLETGRVLEKERTTDHLYTKRQMVRKCREWVITLWVEIVEFQKAFDSIQHVGNRSKVNRSASHTSDSDKRCTTKRQK